MDEKFERSLGAESDGDRHLLIGSFLVPPFVMPCANEKPVTCDLPGVTVEVLNVLASFYRAQFEIVDFPAAGLGFPAEKNGTVVRSLIDGTVQVGVPNMWYTAERVANLPNFSFPLSTGTLCAIMAGNSPLISASQADTLDVRSQGLVWGTLLIFGLIIYFSFYLFERNFGKNLSSFSRHFLGFNIFLHSMVLQLYLNFSGSTIAISLFQAPPKRFPFQTFDQLADAALSGTVNLMGVKASAPARFITPGEALAHIDDTFMKF